VQRTREHTVKSYIRSSRCRSTTANEAITLTRLSGEELAQKNTLHFEPVSRRAIMSAALASKPLSKGGQLFFSSLVASTFGLGVWQSQRYFEKEELMRKRKQELSNPPVPLPPYTVCAKSELRGDASPIHHFEIGYYPPLQKSELKENNRVKLTGAYRCSDTILIGPRGPPPGSLDKSGPNAAMAGKGGMSTSPQGYYLITPLRRLDGKGTVLVNRGWLPMSMRDRTDIICKDDKGIVDVTGVLASMEQPRRFSPDSRSSMTTNRRRYPGVTPKFKTLLWMDRVAIEEETHTMGLYPPLITQTEDNTKENNVLEFPIVPSSDAVGQPKVTSATHAGYAATWFGLSGFGFIMTRKLLLRGR